MTEHFSYILNINRPVDESVLNYAPDFSAIVAEVDWSEPDEEAMPFSWQSYNCAAIKQRTRSVSRENYTKYALLLLILK